MAIRLFTLVSLSSRHLLEFALIRSIVRRLVMLLVA